MGYTFSCRHLQIFTYIRTPGGFKFHFFVTGFLVRFWAFFECFSASDCELFCGRGETLHAHTANNKILLQIDLDTQSAWLGKLESDSHTRAHTQTDTVTDTHTHTHTRTPASNQLLRRLLLETKHYHPSQKLGSSYLFFLPHVYKCFLVFVSSDPCLKIPLETSHGRHLVYHRLSHLAGRRTNYARTRNIVHIKTNRSWTNIPEQKSVMRIWKHKNNTKKQQRVSMWATYDTCYTLALARVFN